jgi:beta-glucosidase
MQVLFMQCYASGPSAYDKVIPSTLDQNILKQEAKQFSKADVVLLFWWT